MWSRRPASGVSGAAGKDAVSVAEDDQVAHPGWWVVGVDGVTALHVEDGLDDDLWWPTQDLILARVAAPAFDGADAGGAVLVEVGGLDWT